jgi:putative flippase GtrA
MNVMRKLKQFSHHASWFTIIGIVAAMTHYIVAVGLESLFLLKPSWANIIGFISAFPVSYFGHLKLTFAATNASHQQALPKFFTIALMGFIGNQSLVLLLLAKTFLPFWMVLGFVMVVVAVSTYFLSHFWAFKS